MTTRVRARHDVAPLEYRVTWKQLSEISQPWVQAQEILVERVARILGERVAAEVSFELASGRCPKFIPGGK